MSNDYIISVHKQFQYYKQLGDKTFDQLSDEQLFWRPDEESNSIAILVKHLWGNMRSRWTGFLTEDGEKDWRDRDSEFIPDIKSRKEMLAKWEEGWSCLFEALEPLSETDLGRIVFIRNQGHTVVEAINRQLAHYAYHVGQIVLIGKMLRSDQWTSLSIPRGGSEDFNKEKFGKERERGHFTDDFLRKK